MAAAPDVLQRQRRCANVDGGGAQRAAMATALHRHRWRRRPTCSGGAVRAATSATLCQQRQRRR
eukprot:5065516-Pleurochrysis_carterae.AAC.1